MKKNLPCLNSCTHTLSSLWDPSERMSSLALSQPLGITHFWGLGSVSDPELESGRGSPGMLRDACPAEETKTEAEKRGGEV